MKTPILYKSLTQTRFTDLDSYNHVNFTCYFEFVITSRLHFLKEKFNISLHEMANLGVGFYVTQAEIKYLRPVRGITNVMVESFVEEVINNSQLRIPFKIYDPANGKSFSEGNLWFSIVDLVTGKPAQITSLTEKLFFE